jgi:glycosyltransferase involved in cell wall biosynthesis
MGAWPIYAAAVWWKLNRRDPLRRKGFKFTDTYLDALWKRNLPSLGGAAVVSNFQVYGPYFMRSHGAFGVEPYLYIDGSLHEYFDHYGPFEAAEIDDNARLRALEFERESYAAVRKIVVMNARSATVLSERYEVPRWKIHVVPPGANILEPIPQVVERRLARRAAACGRSLVIGFVGFYPERKGLPILAETVSLLRRSGYDVRLHVVGNCPPNIAEREEVTYFGPIDKRTDLRRYMEIVGNVDLGCLLSRAEFSPIALIEFLRLGVPVLATNVGGIPDIIELGAGLMVPADSSADHIASVLGRLIDEPECLLELKQRAWERRLNASWRRVVTELKRVLH